MKLKILGTIGNIPIKIPGHEKHSGVLINNELLVDIGEEEYLEYKPKFIIISHLHPDHAFFVTGRKILKTGIPVFAPEPSVYAPQIQVIEEKEFQLKEFKIIPVPAIHSLKVKSYGYIIESNGKRIFYTGDVAAIENQY
jgi:glyoxylase-like metal-dependent hydrolase (beta-lactamase superfamily II)